MVALSMSRRAMVRTFSISARVWRTFVFELLVSGGQLLDELGLVVFFLGVGGRRDRGTGE